MTNEKKVEYHLEILPTTLYLIRHAQSEGNAHYERGLGRLPPTELGSDLTSLGLAQAQELAQELQSVPFSAVYSSHLLRAQHTARFLAEPWSLTVSQVPDLQEREREKETDNAAAKRFRVALLEILAKHPGETIAVVSHGFVMRTFLHFLKQKELSQMPSGYIQNAGYLHFEAKGGELTLVGSSRVG